MHKCTPVPHEIPLSPELLAEARSAMACRDRVRLRRAFESLAGEPILSLWALLTNEGTEAAVFVHSAAVDLVLAAIKGRETVAAPATEAPDRGSPARGQFSSRGPRGKKDRRFPSPGGGR